MIGHTLSFIEATQQNRVPFSVQRYIDDMPAHPSGQFMPRFAIRWCIRKGYIQESEVALAKFGRIYGVGGANWRELRDLLDNAIQHTQAIDLAA